MLYCAREALAHVTIAIFTRLNVSLYIQVIALIFRVWNVLVFP